jgi:hypothetical protein
MKKIVRLTETDLKRIVRRVLVEDNLKMPVFEYDDFSDEEWDELDSHMRREMEDRIKGDEFTYYDPTRSEHPYGGRYVNDSGWWDTHNRPEYSGEWEDYEFGDFTDLKRSDIPNQNYKKLRTRRDFDTLKNPDTGKVHIRKRKY